MPRTSKPAPKLTPADLEPAPRTPAPAWLVRELVRLGDPPETAANRDIRQAYAVANSMRRARGLGPLRRGKS